MMDEIFDRHYQTGRADLNSVISLGLIRLRTAIGNAFEALNRAEYSEPWKETRKTARCG